MRWGREVSAAAQRQLETDLRAEEDDLEDEISGFTAYPVITLGVSYKF